MPLTDDPWLLTDGNGNVPVLRPAAPVLVYKFDGASSLTPLPNVECLGIGRREGTDPGSARFRYNLASGLDGAPISIETALGTGFSGPFVIESGDRLVVQGTRPDGSVECLFDGEAIDFGMGLDPDMEEVYIGAIGIAWHEWDDVIPGALMRNASASGQVVTDIPTDVPAQFNPQGQPNAIPDGYMAGSITNGNDFRYPTFIDPNVVQQPKDLRTLWTLPKACRYLIFNGNPDQKFVRNPDGAALDAMLVSPTGTNPPSQSIICPDTPITGKDWPGTVNRLVTECGFGTSFDLGTDGGGLPVTTFNIFKQQGGSTKSLFLAARGTQFDPSLFNFNSSGLHRDLSEVVNQVTVNGALDRYEASFILSPGFPMASGDSSDSQIKNYSSESPLYITTNRYAYRLYVFDECGEGHYKVGTNTAVTSATSLDDLFGKPNTQTGKPAYVKRRRIPIGQLVTLEGKTNRPFSARLAISTDYGTDNTKGPGLWDGTGTWQQVTSTTWRLLDDRLGIEITDRNPETWEIGRSTNFGDPFYYGTVHGVTNMASFAAGKSFWLRLTCVIEADNSLQQIAMPTGGSPLTTTINRSTDASDRYRNDFVDYPSEFNLGGNKQTLNPRNDDDAALAEAQAVQFGTQSGVLEGPVTIPRLTTYYKIGDRIDQIEGRNLGLRTDQGSGSPILPVVVAVSHSLEGQQTTTVELSDAGTDRTRYARKPGRKQMGHVARGGNAAGGFHAVPGKGPVTTRAVPQ